MDRWEAQILALAKAKRRTEPKWQRPDGSWWEHGPNGKVRRVRTPATAPAHDAGTTPPQHEAVHHHLQQAEDALRAAGHHAHADTVKKVREGLGAPAKVRTPKREWKEHEFPIDIVQRGGPEGMRAFMAALSTKEKRAYLKKFNLVNADDRRGNDAALIQLGVQAAVEKHARIRTGGYRGPEKATVGAGSDHRPAATHKEAPVSDLPLDDPGVKAVAAQLKAARTSADYGAILHHMHNDRTLGPRHWRAIAHLAGRGRTETKAKAVQALEQHASMLGGWEASAAAVRRASRGGE